MSTWRRAVALSSPQVLLRVREQPMGGYTASADMPDGRRLRVCGTSTSDKSTVVGLLKQTVTWVRRGSFA